MKFNSWLLVGMIWVGIWMGSTLRLMGEETCRCTVYDWSAPVKIGLLTIPTFIMGFIAGIEHQIEE